MDTTLIARRLLDPQIRKAFTTIHGSYRDIIAKDLDCDYLLCTHSLDSLDAESMLPECRRVIDLVKTGQSQRLPYEELGGIPMRCFWNVLNAAEQNGGHMQTGWLVSAFNTFTGVDLCWHGAWQRPEGDVVEVTPGYQRCVFVPSNIMPPTTFTARTFSSIEDMGLCIASTVNLGFNPGEHRDDGYILKSGMPVDLREAVWRARLRVFQQVLAPKKSRFKQRSKRR